MWCGGMSFMLIIALLTGSVLSHQNEINDGIIANNSLEFRTSPTDEMTTLIYTSSAVWHMEPDLFLPDDNILFSDNRALRTTDGVASTTIAGSPHLGGNKVAVGQLARFGIIGGFRQISPTHVVIVDYSYHCLRLVDRLTLQTPWYAGNCASSGYSQGTTGARFSEPRGIIIDKKQAGMLLVADFGNDAIRHVRITVGGGLSAVSQFYKSSTLNRPVGLTQDPISGDLYITIYGNGGRVYKLTYTTRYLTSIAGSSRGFADGDFGSSRFNKPSEIILIDNGTKLMLSDKYNDRLRLLDLITRKTSSLCTGVPRPTHSDGDMSSCTLQSPYSLMVLNNTLYVGETLRIRKIQDHSRLRRRLVFQAQYDVQCELPSGNVAESFLTMFGALHTFSYSEICATDCKKPDDADIELTCTNHTLTVVWPSNITYTGDVNRIPAELDQVLTSRIVAKGLAFVLFLPEITPPFVYPEQEESGGYMTAKLSSYCIGEDVSYVKVTDSCDQQNPASNP